MCQNQQVGPGKKKPHQLFSFFLNKKFLFQSSRLLVGNTEIKPIEFLGFFSLPTNAGF